MKSEFRITVQPCLHVLLTVISLRNESYTSTKRRGMKRAVRLQRLGSLTSTRPNDMEDETKEDGLDQLPIPGKTLRSKLYNQWKKRVLPIKNSLCSLNDNKFRESRTFFLQNNNRLSVEKHKMYMFCLTLRAFYIFSVLEIQKSASNTFFSDK